MENEDLRQRLQILEALTGRDTSFISIMEDTSINMMSYFGGKKEKPSQKSTVLAPINEEQQSKHHSITRSAKPPKRGNVAVSGYSAYDLGHSQLSLVGHRQRSYRSGQGFSAKHSAQQRSSG